MSREINEKNDIIAPHELAINYSAMNWPLKWGQCPPVADDPCDAIPHLTAIYLMQAVRHRRAKKQREASGDFTPIRWTRGTKVYSNV